MSLFARNPCPSSGDVVKFDPEEAWVGNSVGNSDVVGKIQEQKHDAHMLQACGLGSSQVVLGRS